MCCTRTDISELNLSKGMNIKFPEGKDKLLVFEITMKPDEGMYKCAFMLLWIDPQIIGNLATWFL